MKNCRYPSVNRLNNLWKPGTPFQYHLITLHVFRLKKPTPNQKKYKRDSEERRIQSLEIIDQTERDNTIQKCVRREMYSNVAGTG
jgi:hypothetical protein